MCKAKRSLTVSSQVVELHSMVKGKLVDRPNFGAHAVASCWKHRPANGRNGWSELRQACIVMGPQVQIVFGQSDPDSADCDPDVLLAACAGL